MTKKKTMEDQRPTNKSAAVLRLREAVGRLKEEMLRLQERVEALKALKAGK